MVVGRVGILGEFGVLVSKLGHLYSAFYFMTYFYAPVSTIVSGVL